MSMLTTNVRPCVHGCSTGRIPGRVRAESVHLAAQAAHDGSRTSHSRLEQIVCEVRSFLHLNEQWPRESYYLRQYWHVPAGPVGMPFIGTAKVIWEA